MKFKKIVRVLFITLLSSHSFLSYATTENCSKVFETPVKSQQINASELISHATQKIHQVAEFEFIRNLAESMGIRVWLFGDTALTFLHYVKADLSTSHNLKEINPLLLDYHFHHIFRSTQTIELITDATPIILEKSSAPT